METPHDVPRNGGAKQEFDALILGKSDDCKSLSAQIEDLERVIARHQADVLRLTAERDQLQVRLYAAHSELTQTRPEDLGRLVDRLRDLSLRIERLEARIATHAAAIADLTAERDRAQVRLYQVHAEIGAVAESHRAAKGGQAFPLCRAYEARAGQMIGRPTGTLELAGVG